jgi:hypothetical protein
MTRHFLPVVLRASRLLAEIIVIIPMHHARISSSLRLALRSLSVKSFGVALLLSLGFRALGLFFRRDLPR